MSEICEQIGCETTRIYSLRFVEYNSLHGTIKHMKEMNLCEYHYEVFLTKELKKRNFEVNHE